MPSALLNPLELDFLWEAHGLGELPYPLRVPSHGVTLDERAALRQRTFAALTGRGLVDDEGRPGLALEDQLGALGQPDVSVDAVSLLGPPGTPVVLANAAAQGTTGVLAVQDPRGTLLRDVPADGLAGAVVGLLPQAPRGKERSVTLPLDALRGGPAAWNGAAEDRETLQRLHAEPRLRGGQLGANARNRTGGRSRSPVLSWFDTQSGRYLTQASQGHDGREWVTIAPADAATLRHRIGEMLAGVADTVAG